jgi:hypothetical protein
MFVFSVDFSKETTNTAPCRINRLVSITETECFLIDTNLIIIYEFSNYTNYSETQKRMTTEHVPKEES